MARDTYLSNEETNWRLTAVAIVFGAMLGGCGRAAGPSGSPRIASASAPEADVWPQVLRDKKSLELGELILLLMPDSGTTFTGWDYKADSPIKWQAEAYTEVPDSGYASRMGWVRVNVQGGKATILRERKLELGWSVTYSNESSAIPTAEHRFLPPKFGVESIDIKPGADGDLSCFGAAFGGCDFREPFASLVQTSIHVETICSKQTADGHVSAFLLTHSGHRPTVMTWTESGGSGGIGSWITLKLDADKQIPQWAHTGNDPDTNPNMYNSNLCQ